METSEEKINSSHALITSLEERIRALEAVAKKCLETVDTGTGESNDEFGTPFSFYGMKKDMPKNRAEMALEFFEIFEELLCTECKEEDLQNYEKFTTTAGNAYDCLRSTREGIARLCQDFMFAQTVRKDGSADFACANL